ncbi:uncharacterized protein LOC123271719 [Cotesia glomerata]|uniref:uncharacterized protein LOC123271719 n=1 Tax=Cotesia glomerata TaxID=32391 RepID=UPI001D015376|nr:uncharacterized protein LOC123271719 [Cotesia glomerata]
MVANESRFTDTLDLMAFTNCVLTKHSPSKCLGAKVDKIVREDNKFVLLILKESLRVPDPEKNIIKLVNGDNYFSDQCYIPYVHYTDACLNGHWSTAFIKTLYKAEIIDETVVVVRDGEGSRIDQYGRSYDSLLKSTIPEEGFPLVCSGSNNKYLMVKMFSSVGDDFDGMSDFYNAPTDLLITQSVKRQIDSIIEKNRLKRNCLRNLVCTKHVVQSDMGKSGPMAPNAN